MKKIKKVEIAGATELTALQMNNIHFETGLHTNPREVSASTSAPAPDRQSTSRSNLHTSLR